MFLALSSKNILKELYSNVAQISKQSHSLFQAIIFPDIGIGPKGYFTGKKKTKILTKICFQYLSLTASCLLCSELIAQKQQLCNSCLGLLRLLLQTLPQQFHLMLRAKWRCCVSFWHANVHFGDALRQVWQIDAGNRDLLKKYINVYLLFYFFLLLWVLVDVNILKG